MRDGFASVAVILGVTVGALITVIDEVRSRPARPQTGMGRAETAIEEVWELSVGAALDVEIDGQLWRVSRPGDGLYHVAELLPDGSLGAVGVLSQRGDVLLDQAW
jgi:hypothetical protein